jgi:hypothetical protein
VTVGNRRTTHHNREACYDALAYLVETTEHRDVR